MDQQRIEVGSAGGGGDRQPNSKSVSISNAIVLLDRIAKDRLSARNAQFT